MHLGRALTFTVIARYIYDGQKEHRQRSVDYMSPFCFVVHLAQNQVLILSTLINDLRDSGARWNAANMISVNIDWALWPGLTCERM